MTDQVRVEREDQDVCSVNTQTYWICRKEEKKRLRNEGKGLGWKKGEGEVKLK
jgi:hypothetical protein